MFSHIDVISRSSQCWAWLLLCCSSLPPQCLRLVPLKAATCFSVQVCELDIIFNFEKAYFILDEFLMGGEIQDTSKKSVLKAIEQADLLQEVADHLLILPASQYI